LHGTVVGPGLWLQPSTNAMQCKLIIVPDNTTFPIRAVFIYTIRGCAHEARLVYWPLHGSISPDYLPILYFFLKKQKGSDPLLINYIKMGEEPSLIQIGNKERKKNLRNYMRASSHEDISTLFLFFALSITKANSIIKC